jgi:hypothetical protein
MEQLKTFSSLVSLSRNSESKQKKEESDETVYKFHLKVKKEVNEIFIYTPNGLIEMTEAFNDSSDRIFNGSIPNIYKGADIQLVLLGEALETEYVFSKLFSLPLDLESPIQKKLYCCKYTT